jgi:predicted molibdopterin-dependent oxidoreductase YjgC
MAQLMGVKYKYTTAEDVFAEIAASVEGFKGMSYRKIGNKGMVLQHQVEKAVPA